MFMTIAMPWRDASAAPSRTWKAPGVIARTVSAAARACRMAQPLCSAFPPAPPMSAEEGARVVAGFARLLRKRRDELARQADGIDQQS